jgi:hypothetical protein
MPHGWIARLQAQKLEAGQRLRARGAVGLRRGAGSGLARRARVARTGSHCTNRSRHSTHASLGLGAVLLKKQLRNGRFTKSLGASRHQRACELGGEPRS